MKIGNGFKLVYEKRDKDDRKLYASKSTFPTETDGALDPNLDKLANVKFVYQKDGRIWGSKENYPTANDTSAIVTVDGVDLFVTDVADVSSLETALTAGGSVTLLGDIVGVTEAIDITAATTLNLNGNTISGVNNNLNRPGFLQITEGSLTVEGNGTIKIDSYVINVGMINSDRSGTVVIKDGYFESDSASVVQLEKGSVTIEGGTFKTNYKDTKYTINKVDNGDGTITISGGRFYKFDPRTNNEITVAGGYQVVEEGDWFVVKPNEE